MGHSRRSVGPANLGRLFVLAAFAAVAAMSLVTRWQPSTFENRPKKSLVVSGGRTVSGMVITNRETEPLSDCVVRVGPPGGSSDWMAPVERLAARETQILTWTQFRNATGSEMPASIAPERTLRNHDVRKPQRDAEGRRHRVPLRISA